MWLYRYRTFDINDPVCLERRKSEIFGNTPYFQSAEDLNDPFECRPWVTIGASREQRSVSLSCLERIFKTGEKIRAAQLAGKMKSTPREILKKIESMGDIALSDIYRTVLRRRGICCFSESPRSLLMWSHYAAAHSGICLIYKFDKDLVDAKHLGRVLYVDEYPEMRLYEFNADQPDVSHAEWGRLSLLRKAPVWSYEKEWRFFGREVGGIKFDEDPRTHLFGVIRGARMSLEAKKVLTEITSGRKKFRTLDATLNYRKYQVDVRNLPDVAAA